MALPEGDHVPAEETIQILIVDDEPMIRFVAAEVLRELGVGVIEAATADEAWAYLQAGTRVDLVFTDHRMPGSMSGAELVARIVKDYPMIETVIASGFYDSPERPTVVISKPYNMDQLAPLLMERVKKKRG